MKKLFLLITVLLAAISVVAQSDLMSVRGISKGQVYVTSSDVYGTTWGQCAGACTNQCMEAKQGTREECDKLCTDECHPQPDVITKRIPPRNPVPPIQPEPRTCDDVCALKFKVCGDSQRGTDCKSLFEQCAKGCPPQSCEGRCEMIRNECKEANINPQSCQMKIEDCKRNCKPECPAIEGCPVKCTGMYYECRSDVKEGCEQVLVGCLESCRPGRVPPPVFRCEDKCVKIENDCVMAGNTKEACMPRTEECMNQCRIPPRRCEDKCMLIIDECLKAGVDEVSCKLKVDDCVRRCNPEKQLETEQMRRPERTNAPSVKETGDVSLLGRIWHIFTG